jgi:hypothetical protein
MEMPALLAPARVFVFYLKRGGRTVPAPLFLNQK